MPFQKAAERFAGVPGPHLLRPRSVQLGEPHLQVRLEGRGVYALAALVRSRGSLDPGEVVVSQTHAMAWMTDAIDMDGAQVAVADYRPDWWPAKTFLLIRRVRLGLSQISADPRSRRRRTLHPHQRTLPLAGLAEADAVYGYSFILTNLDVSTPERTVAVEHWYRHRTQVEKYKDKLITAWLARRSRCR